jgi:hypothetical protein
VIGSGAAYPISAYKKRKQIWATPDFGFLEYPDLRLWLRLRDEDADSDAVAAFADCLAGR